MRLAIFVTLPVFGLAYCTGDWYCRNTAWYGWDYTCEKQGSGGWDAWNCVKTKNLDNVKSASHQYYPAKGCIKWNYLSFYRNTGRDVCMQKCDANKRCKAFYMPEDEVCQLTSCNKDYTEGATCTYDDCTSDATCGYECESPDLYIRDDHYDANYVPNKIAFEGTTGQGLSNLDERVKNIEGANQSGRRRMQCMNEAKGFQRPQAIVNVNDGELVKVEVLKAFPVEKSFCTLATWNPLCELNADGDEWELHAGAMSTCKAYCTKAAPTDHCGSF